MSKQIQEVCDLLNDMKINFKLTRHQAAYTVDEIEALHLPDEDVIAKNLFVRDDKKRQYYLLVVRKEKKVELKALEQKLYSRRLSFASENELNSILGLTKGSVTPFGIIHDDARKVKVIIDSTFKKSLIGIHPNENIATIWLQVTDLVRVIKEQGNDVEFVAF